MEEMTLKEWTILFVKNKDIVKKDLLSYEEKENKIKFSFKDKVHIFMVLNNLDNSVLSFIKTPFFKTVVCQAMKQNLEFLLSNWDVFKDVENLSFIFVRIENNTRWIISPIVHNHICDDSSLVFGLKSMYTNAFR